MIRFYTVTDGSLREYQQTVRLDGADYILKLSWNSVLDHWVLSVYLTDQALTPVVEGRMVTLFTDLLRGVVIEGRPPGKIIAIPVDGRILHAGLTTLGTRVLLGYRTAAEVEADG